MKEKYEKNILFFEGRGYIKGENQKDDSKFTVDSLQCTVNDTVNCKLYTVHCTQAIKEELCLRVHLSQ